MMEREGEGKRREKKGRGGARPIKYLS